MEVDTHWADKFIFELSDGLCILYDETHILQLGRYPNRQAAREAANDYAMAEEVYDDTMANC